MVLAGIKLITCGQQNTQYVSDFSHQNKYCGLADAACPIVKGLADMRDICLEAWGQSGAGALHADCDTDGSTDVDWDEPRRSPVGQISKQSS